MPGMRAEGGMRSSHWILTLILCSFLVAFVPCTVIGDTSKTPTSTQVIPTKYRLLQVMIEEESQVKDIQAVSNPVILPEREGSHNAVQMSSESAGTSDLSANVQPDTSYQGMGRGFVQTNFDVNMVDQGKRVENREKLTARGLFNVHVVHEFN